MKRILLAARLGLALVGILLPRLTHAADGVADPVSYYKHIRPIFQAQCNGCHQPAKPQGAYVMTSFDKLLKGGESGSAAVVAGQADKSHLIAQIKPVDGKADMPKEKPPLSAGEIALIVKWVEQGAKDDTPADAERHYDAEHPPEYVRPATIPSLDYSPDGKLLAVAGFHEVVLLDPATGQRQARLIGHSERIETVRFSPDGKRLAVAGGSPGRTGEIQVWEVESRKLLLSAPVTANTVYGASWSPDGKAIAFGCGDNDDNTLRAINAETGEQILYQGAHTDWVRDTAFSVDGAHLVSVARDMTVKLTEVATQRFVDNVTSITPGALKGGNQTVARHPRFDHVVVGGADGTPKVYRLFRETSRIIGDDANLIMELFPLPGRVFSVRFSADGKRIACGSSLDGAGEVVICSYDYNEDVPKDLRTIMGKVPASRSAGDREALEAYRNQGVKLLARVALPAAIYAVAFDPSGKQLAAAGSDGLVRILDAESGQTVRQFPAAVVSPASAAAEVAGTLRRPTEVLSKEQLPAGAKVVALEVQPTAIDFNDRFDYAQLLVTARLESGETPDVTRMVTVELTSPVAEVANSGLVQPKVDGQAQMRLSLGGQSATVGVKVSGLKSPHSADYVTEVMPVVSKLGCNQGTCHGSAKGKNGFKLSLRGYDPLFDIRALTDDLASRRVNPASPSASLMLLKASSEVPHTGGQLTKPGDAYYELLDNWIRHGAQWDVKSPRVAKIEIFPRDPIVSRPGDRQQVRVLATYTDGKQRDVTQEAFVDSANIDVATSSKSGLLTAGRRGEAPVLARYEGSYAATTLTVMGDRTGFVWQDPPAWGRVDELVAKKWQRMKILPSDVASDAEFLRRVHLDLTGLPPTADEVRAFTADSTDNRAKREAVIDRLVGSPPYVEYWTNKWADLLQVNRKFLGAEGSTAFRKWVREQVAANKPYDQFVREILTASGSNREHPQASYFKILREAAPTMENTTHLFLGVRFNCNKCHDHPFERWTQDQYYQTAAYFAQTSLKGDPASGESRIGGTAVEGAKPLYEIVYDAPSGDIKHDRTGQVAPPQFPFACKFQAGEKASRREQLAAWISSADNPYFARSYVNRLWGYLFGAGLMEPIDDLRAGNPPSNAELLDYLTRQFVDSGFNVQHMMKLIVKSRTYQLSFVPNKWNEDDKSNYSHAIARRLPAEVLYDTVYAAVGSTSKIPGVKPGMRAAELPDSGVELPSGFLATFGRPVRESACECERSAGLQLGPVMALISGSTIADAIADSQNALVKLVAETKDDRELVNEIFLRILNRPATAAEIDASLKVIGVIDSDHEQLVKALATREAEVAPIRAQQEKDQVAAVAVAKQELEAYEKEIAPRVAAAQKAKDELTARLDAEVKSYEAGDLLKKQAEWEKKQTASVEWIPLRPSAVRGAKGMKLAVQSDRSIFVDGQDAKGALTIDVDTDLRGITAFRLEALPDERLPKGGPGRAADGNFVLTEFEVNAVSKADAKQSKKIEFKRAEADFAQDNFNIAKTIDGRPNGAQGWAVSPSLGVPHWAVFECKESLGFEGGTRLSFKLSHNFNQLNYVLGRFRLSVAVAKPPLALGVSEDLQSVLAVPAAERDKTQLELLAKYYRSVDPDLRGKQKALGESRKPLPIDPRLKELQEIFDLASKPIPLDTRLAQLREDVKQSSGLLTNKRLTGIQDLSWALVNSPAFLFNH